MYYLKLYLFTFVGFLAIDMVWLTVVARGFYRKQLGFLLSDQPNLWAAFAFYLLFVAGLLVFAIVPAVEAGSATQGPASGRLFRLGHLRDLRPDEPGNGQELAVDRDACGHDVGCRPRHVGQLPRIPGRTLARVTAGTISSLAGTPVSSARIAVAYRARQEPRC